MRRLALVAVCVFVLVPMRAHAVVTCASPSGLEGEVIYNADYKVVQFCDGNSNWIKVGGVTTDARIGTLTATKWCAANAGGTAFDCTQNAPVDTGMTALIGDITASGSGSVAATIANSAVTYAKLQNASGPSLLGRSTASAGVFSEITVGSGLSLSAGTLSVSSGNASSGTAGYVQYSGGSGTFSSDSTASNQFFWDSTNHRLGIGTASPAYPLDVGGRVRFAGWGSPAISGAGLELGYDGANSYIRSYDRNTSAYKPLYLDASNIILGNSSGNVGIGTTNPQAALHISAAAGAVRITRTTGNTGDWYIGPGNAVDRLIFSDMANSHDNVWFNSNGDIVARGTVYDSDGAVHASSDVRLKKNIRPVSGALQKIGLLKPVLFDWRHPALHGDIQSTGGFVAQDVQKVFPNLVSETECTGADCSLVQGGKTYTLGLGPLFNAYLVGAIQELKADNDNLRIELKATNDNEAVEIRELRDEIKVLKASLR